MHCVYQCKPRNVMPHIPRIALVDKVKKDALASVASQGNLERSSQQLHSHHYNKRLIPNTIARKNYSSQNWGTGAEWSVHSS